MPEKGEPEHTKRVRETVVSFKNGEPSSIEVFVEYTIRIPEFGPKFEATGGLKERYDEQEAEHILDAVYSLAYSDEEEWEDVRDELQSEGFITVDARGGVGRAKVHAEDIAWKIVEQEVEHTGGMHARWRFDVEDGEATVSEVEKIQMGFASEDAMPIEVLRTLPAATHAAQSVPGVDDVAAAADVVTELMQEGIEADWTP